MRLRRRTWRRAAWAAAAARAGLALALVGCSGDPGARLVAEPARQVPIPGAEVPGTFWHWLVWPATETPHRAVAQVAEPAAHDACQPLAGDLLKPAYRCRHGRVTYVLQ